MMREMVDAGCEYCFMECSSHAIVQRRTRGLHFAGGVFSNITHDHLDYHKTFAEYIRAKKLFFDGLPAEAFALTNADDRNGEVMVQNTAARVKHYALRTMADYRCKIVEMHLDGMLLRIDGREVWVGLLGRFNAYNLLAVYAVAVELGFGPEEVLRVLSSLHPVDGRFESYGQPMARRPWWIMPTRPMRWKTFSAPSRRSARRSNNCWSYAAAAATATGRNVPRWRKSRLDMQIQRFSLRTIRGTKRPKPSWMTWWQGFRRVRVTCASPTVAKPSARHRCWRRRATFC